MAGIEKIDHTTEIKVTVGLNKDNLPLSIDWSSNGKNEKAKAMLVSFFDHKSGDTLKVDLWVKDMQVDEMDKFFFQTLRSMSDTYMKATGNTEMANAMRSFVDYFGQQTKILIDPNAPKSN